MYKKYQSFNLLHINVTTLLLTHILGYYNSTYPTLCSTPPKDLQVAWNPPHYTARHTEFPQALFYVLLRDIGWGPHKYASQPLLTPTHQLWKFLPTFRPGGSVRESCEMLHLHVFKTTKLQKHEFIKEMYILTESPLKPLSPLSPRGPFVPGLPC